MRAGLAVACYTVFRDGANGYYRVRIPPCQPLGAFQELIRQQSSEVLSTSAPQDGVE
jgi:hypothetical protein